MQHRIRRDMATITDRPAIRRTRQINPVSGPGPYDDRIAIFRVESMADEHVVTSCGPPSRTVEERGLLDDHVAMLLYHLSGIPPGI